MWRLGKRYTMAMVDIDHFKQFNDTYGHHVGDQLLRMVGFKLAALRGGGRTADEALREADQALYRAKAAGRDQIAR